MDSISQRYREDVERLNKKITLLELELGRAVLDMDTARELISKACEVFVETASGSYASWIAKAKPFIKQVKGGK